MSMGGAQDRTTETDNDNNSADYTKNSEDSRNDSTNSASVGGAPSGWVHSAGIHLAEIGVAHDPGGNTEEPAKHQSKYT
jgi:hypothetical protein